jgi:cell division ATPase FtsA
VADGFKPFRKKELAAVVAPEIDRFVNVLKRLISDSGISGLSGAKIVVTGGLSLLEGLLEKMESDMGQAVKMGIPQKAGDIPLSQAPSYAGAIGLLLCQAQRQEMFLGLKVPTESKNKVSKFIDYVTNLYHDYF